MILPKTFIKHRINERSKMSGIDTYDVAGDKQHWLDYPFDIEYNFNSRGFRDSEWPLNENDLKESIWCLGDSFTSGVGIPFDHTWPQVLKKKTKKHTINVSLDGASNNWIARQARYIIDEITPKNLVIQWSFVNRREKEYDELVEIAWKPFYSKIKSIHWPNVTFKEYKQVLPLNVIKEIENNPYFNNWQNEIDYDSEGRIRTLNCSIDEDYFNFQMCLDQLAFRSKTNIIHSFVPDWHLGTWENEGQNIYSKFDWHGQKIVKELQTVDFGRDNFHYDIKTADKLCKLISLELV